MLEIQEKDPLEIFIEGSSVILKKYNPNCVFCGSSKDLHLYKNKLVCAKCKDDINNL